MHEECLALWSSHRHREATLFVRSSKNNKGSRSAVRTDIFFPAHSFIQYRPFNEMQELSPWFSLARFLGDLGETVAFAATLQGWRTQTGCSGFLLQQTVPPDPCFACLSHSREFVTVARTRSGERSPSPLTVSSLSLAGEIGKQLMLQPRSPGAFLIMNLGNRLSLTSPAQYAGNSPWL